MNLNYSVEEIATCVNGRIVGDHKGVVRQVSFDSRSPLINESTLFFAIEGQKSHGHQFIPEFIKKGGKIAIVEKELSAVSCTQIVVSNSIEALHQLAINHRKKFNIPVIAVAGSNGKTTVKEWLYHTLKNEFSIVRSPKSYNSQIGVPLSILEIMGHHELAIIEAGISRRGEMKKLKEIIKPTIGIFTGVGSAHSQGFNSIIEKEQEKMLLFSEVKALFSSDNIDYVNHNEIVFNNKAALLNASLVKATAKHLNCPDSIIANGLATLPSISMRMEKMEGMNGCVLINDTYTFDEKGLEIALKSIEANQIQKSKILVLAPELDYQPTKDFISIIESSQIDTLVWIFPTKLKLSKLIEVKHITCVQEFIKNPISFSNAVILFSGSRSMELERCIPLYQLKKHVTQLEIHLDSVRKNLNFYRNQLSPSTQVLAMVKAQSYGSGSVEMAKFLEKEKVNALGVAYADEGVALINEGIELPILVMNPEQSAFDDIIDYKLEPSIYSIRILDQFLNQLILRGKTRVPIHIKLDTGMHRLGFMPNQISELIETLNAQPEVYVKGVFSHLVCSGSKTGREFTAGQIKEFTELCDKIEAGIGYGFLKHLANTEGIVNYPQSHFSMVRLGIGLFGLAGNSDAQQENALSFKTHISQIKTIRKGQTVGYGCSFIAQKDMVIGVVPVGYADGLSRILGNGNWNIKVNDVLVPVIGSICMDMCMLDLSSTTCSEGDTAEVFGWDKSIQEMANQLNTIPYEIISSISSRVQRVYID
ncbi:MAG: alanine racemase [Crocinitomicaceae bacterium]